MANPWLEVPLADYEGHMASPEIGQAQMLADELDLLVKRIGPQAAADRCVERLNTIEFICADVQSESMRFEPVDLIYAGLLFEYVDVPSTIAALKRNSRPGGTLATVLQLPSADLSVISTSRYKSLNPLSHALRLVDPSHLTGTAVAAGYLPLAVKVIELPSGKRFCEQTFRLDA